MKVHTRKEKLILQLLQHFNPPFFYLFFKFFNYIVLGKIIILAFGIGIGYYFARRRCLNDNSNPLDLIPRELREQIPLPISDYDTDVKTGFKIV